MGASSSAGKRSVRDLAIFDAPPAFSSPVHVGAPNLPRLESFVERVEEIFARGWLSNEGVMSQRFEERVAELSGSRHCVATANGTIALQLAIRACGLTGEVIVPSFTFVATAHAVQWQGLTPVFADVGEDHLIDTDSVERVITPRTSAILGVHVWGNPCRVEELERLARKYRLTLLFDAAHAFGCRYDGRPIGSFGAAEVFSFHATKYLTTAEGGAVVTNDDALAERLRSLRNFGFVGRDRVEALGINGKMNELCAALGLAALERADEIVEVNRRNLATYRGLVADLPGIRLHEPTATDGGNHQYVVLEIDPACGLTRDELLVVLTAELVLARRYFYPGCHRMEPYRTLDPDAGRRLPRTEHVASRVLVLPTGLSVSTEDIERISHLIHLALSDPGEVRARLLATRAVSY